MRQALTLQLGFRRRLMSPPPTPHRGSLLPIISRLNFTPLTRQQRWSRKSTIATPGMCPQAATRAGHSPLPESWHQAWSETRPRAHRSQLCPHRRKPGAAHRRPCCCRRREPRRGLLRTRRWDPRPGTPSRLRLRTSTHRLARSIRGAGRTRAILRRNGTLRLRPYLARPRQRLSALNPRWPNLRRQQFRLTRRHFILRGALLRRLASAWARSHDQSQSLLMLGRAAQPIVLQRRPCRYRLRVQCNPSRHQSIISLTARHPRPFPWSCLRRRPLCLRPRLHGAEQRGHRIAVARSTSRHPAIANRRRRSCTSAGSTSWSRRRQLLVHRPRRRQPAATCSVATT